MISVLTDKKLLLIVMVGLVLQLGVLYAHFFIAPHPNSTGDSIRFEEQAKELVEDIAEGTTWSLPRDSGSAVYILVVTLFFLLFGESILPPILFNVVLSLALVFIVFAIARELVNSRRAAYLAALLSAVFPTSILYATVLQREALFIFFFAVSLYAFVRWMKEGKVGLMLGALAAGIVSAIIHFGILPVLMVYSAFFLFYLPRRDRWRLVDPRELLSRTVLKWAIVLVPIIFFIGTVDLSGTKYAPSLEHINSYLQKTVERGQSSYLEDRRPSTYLQMAVQTPERIAHFLFAPFPWDIERPQDRIGLVISVTFLVVMFFTVRGLIRLGHSRRNIAIALALIMIAFLVTYAWGTSNYGTSLRHKNKIVWLMILLFSLGVLPASRWDLPELPQTKR
ncbi:MAG: glycosyltransferase family 39 protein [Candidatus Paceibacterota bacterium]